MFFKKILMPCGLCSALPAVKPMNLPQDHSSESRIKKLIRPSELPIYTFKDEHVKEIPCKDCPPSTLEQNVSKIRKSVQSVISEYDYYTSIVSNNIEIGVEHSRSLLDYLREESNVIPRVGAIGIGGLAGLVFGLRGRTLKRLTYTSTGALAMGALCYPKKVEQGVALAKHYANVSYNFIYGVKPGDDRQLDVVMPELPKMPSSFSEFVDLSIVAASTAATAVNNFAQSAYAFLSDGKERNQSMDKPDNKQN